MRILYILPTFSVGGAEKLLLELIPFINEQDKNLVIELLVLTKKNDVFSQKMQEKGVTVTFLSDKLSVRNPLNILKLRKFIVNGQFDIVHAHLFPVQYWVIFALMGVRRKPFLVFTEHSTNNTRRKCLFLRPLESFIYKRYDQIISISGQVEKELLNWLKWDKNKRKKPSFAVISNGVSVEKIINAEPISKSALYETAVSGTRSICMVGRFVPAKDQATLIRACTYLDQNVHLLLVGDGETLSKNKELACELDLSPRIHFLGVRTDIERILKSVDIVVLSSFWEGFGIAAVEGLAAGKPVVVSNVGGLREVVNDDELLFPAGDCKQLSLILIKLLTNKEFYRQKSANSLERSMLFTIQNTASEHTKLYFKFISNP